MSIIFDNDTDRKTSFELTTANYEVKLLTFIEPDENNDTRLSDQEMIEFANEIGYGYVAPIIFAIGLAGNVANVIVLKNKKKFSGRLYSYLRALAITDIICLCFAISFIVHLRARPYTIDHIHTGQPTEVILILK